MGKRLKKYKDRCRKFWGACLLAGKIRTQENKGEEEVPPKKAAIRLLIIVLWLLVIVGIISFAILAGHHLWVRIIQPIWVEYRSS